MRDCPKCGASEDKIVRTNKKIKGRFVRNCTACNHFFMLDMKQRHGRCICGLKTSECDGHNHYVQYAEQMGTDVIYRGTSFTGMIQHGDW